MTRSNRSVAEIAADAIMALETLLYELEDDRLITIALHAALRLPGHGGRERDHATQGLGRVGTVTQSDRRDIEIRRIMRATSIVGDSNKWSLDVSLEAVSFEQLDNAYDELQAWASGMHGRSERPGRWLLMEIGCLECQEPSRVVATFPTEADAEAARREVAAESSTLTQYGVFDLCVEDAQWPE